MSRPDEGVFNAKVDWVNEQVGGDEEKVGTAEASQQMVENIPHRPRIWIYIFDPRSILGAKSLSEFFQAQISKHLKGRSNVLSQNPDFVFGWVTRISAKSFLASMHNAGGPKTHSGPTCTRVQQLNASMTLVF